MPATARLMQEGAAVFLPAVERVLGASLPAQAAADPGIHPADRDPMVPAETLGERALPEADRAPMIAGYGAWLLGLQGNWNVVADEPNSDALPYRAVREPIARCIARSHLSAAHAAEEPPSGR